MDGLEVGHHLGGGVAEVGAARASRDAGLSVATQLLPRRIKPEGKQKEKLVKLFLIKIF